jgi:hypothetical protein
MVTARRLQATAELGRLAAFWLCKNGASTRTALVMAARRSTQSTLWLAGLKWLYQFGMDDSKSIQPIASRILYGGVLLGQALKQHEADFFALSHEER